MNLLLLLSALLSALSGMGASARQPQVAHAVAQQAQVASEVTARRIAARPVQPLASLVTSAAWGLWNALTVAPIAPRFASRRRE